jgi:hypothetical protein
LWTPNTKHYSEVLLCFFPVFFFPWLVGIQKDDDAKQSLKFTHPNLFLKGLSSLLRVHVHQTQLGVMVTAEKVKISHIRVNVMHLVCKKYKIDNMNQRQLENWIIIYFKSVECVYYQLEIYPVYKNNPFL